jgi:peptide/nickel transport system permease protein
VLDATPAEKSRVRARHAQPVWPAQHRRHALEWATALRRLTHDRVGMIGVALVTVVIAIAIAGPWLAPFDPTTMDVSMALAPPGPRYLLGTDDLGRDLLSRVLHGARVSVPVALACVSLASLLGSTLGLLCGYFRGKLDAVVMRVMDIIFAFPSLVLGLAFVAVLGPDLRNLLIALAIVFTPSFARIARGATMKVSAEQYVEAARVTGAGEARILVGHVLPNAVAPLIVQFSTSLAGAILIEASLSFLGLGVQPPAPSWGSMLSTGKTYLDISAWFSLWPGLAIFITVLGFNLLGDGIRDASDPFLTRR